MDRKKFEIRKQGLLPGYEEGRFEPRRSYEQGEFQASLDDGFRRDSRVSIKVSGKDLDALKKLALDQGLPLQSLLSHILHEYANGALRPAGPGEDHGRELEEAPRSLAFPFESGE